MRSIQFVPALICAALCADIAYADALCGNTERTYMDKLVSGLQPFAHQVTPTGEFATKEEFGNGTMAILISFIDNGKTLFSYRAGGTDEWAAVLAKPLKTKSGQPAFGFSFAQGKVASCDNEVFVKDGRFVSTPIRTTMARRR